MNKHWIGIRPGSIVTLANGQPAWTENRRIRQSDIDRHGSAEKARTARGEA